MFRVDEKLKKIEMNKGDFGLILTFTLDEIQEGSNFKLKVYNKEGNEEKNILEKDITNVTGNQVNVSLTKEESDKLNEGTYYWSFLQYIKNTLHNTILKDRLFEVEAGA
jgi:hypothetical protein